MKALAYRNYVPGQDGYLCCACVERDQRQSDYPHLFFVTTHPKRLTRKCGARGADTRSGVMLRVAQRNELLP
jgi:hypothetical protein